MKIIVCIKQVPNTTDVRINPETNTLIREGVESIINPFDMYAIEEAIRLKERLQETVEIQTLVITMGPPQAESALREALSMGIDEAVLVSDRAFAGSDTWATSYTLTEAIKTLGDYLVILFGKQASDGDTAQVGPGVAAHLDIPQITFVRKIEKMEKDCIVAERLMEYGYDVISSPLPAVITVVKEINEPRLPSLRGKMRAKKAEIKKITSDDINVEKKLLGLDGSPTIVKKIFSPPKKEPGRIFQEHELEDGLDFIVKTIREQNII
ncbi:MAG: electron transfer flavoprotein subunit beta/FixA family protein [Candidatus Aureabacteria bacterium]|nr:electron transfer flavoprotein subunit beta/FixA family protein [Candidatus Auribacterota bacterium]